MRQIHPEGRRVQHEYGDKQKERLMLELATRSQTLHETYLKVSSGDGEPVDALREALNALNANSRLVRQYAGISEDEYRRFTLDRF